MGKIIAIGGGEIGKNKVMPNGTFKTFPIQTMEIDMALVQMANKPQPKVLFLPTASQDNPSYIQLFYQYYGDKLGCLVDDLQLISQIYSDDEIRTKIENSDIIYVGGGDTRLMLEIWRKYHLDIYLKKAYEKGTILAGLSAGAVCWFEYYANTDYMEAENLPLGLLKGLGLISGFAMPHLDILSSSLKQDIISLLKQKNLSGFGIDECAALVFEDGKISILSSQNEKTVVKLP